MESHLKPERAPSASAVPYVAGLLRSDPELDVFQALSTDAHTPRLAARSRRTGRWYGFLVYETSPGEDAIVPEADFRPAGDQLVAVVVVGGSGVPDRAYLVRGSEWADERTLPSCLTRDLGSRAERPFVGVRTGHESARAELDLWYAAERVIATL